MEKLVAHRLKCVHGGGAFYLACNSGLFILDLKPISIGRNLTNALSRQNIRVDVPCRFTIAISTETDSMNTAAERLLGFGTRTNSGIGERYFIWTIAFLVIATMTIEEINSDKINS